MFNGNTQHITSEFLSAIINLNNDDKMKPHYKISIIYFIISVLWIFFSDRLILSFDYSPVVLTNIQTYKGWFFVLTTSLFLFIIIKKEQVKLEQKVEEKHRLYKTTLRAVHHILNNFLLKMTFFKQAAEERQAIDKETINIFDKVIFETAEELKKLGDIENPTDEKVNKAVYNKTKLNF